MKKLVIYDFDGTLIDSPEPDPGKEIWKQKTGEEYPHKGWWGRRESLNTDVFDIKPIPSMLSKFKRDIVNPNAYVVILTSRMEKLRPELENILNMHNIVPDDVIMKRGAETKGDVILKYINAIPDLVKIEVYDDFAGGMENKIKEYTDIKDQIPSNIEYDIYRVNDGSIALMESTNNLLKIVFEELRKLRS